MLKDNTKFKLEMDKITKTGILRPRLNEVGNHIEPFMIEALNEVGLKVDRPTTKEASAPISKDRSSRVNKADKRQSLTIDRIISDAILNLLEGMRQDIPKVVSSHVLHHIFAVNCIKKGISTRALQGACGIQLITAEIYLGLSLEDALREFLNK